MKPCTNCVDLVNGCDPVNTNGVIYSGPNLPCSTVTTSDTLTVALQKIDTAICSVAIDQNNFVRQLFISVDDLPLDYTLQDICDYILGLPTLERTVVQTDSKWNVIITTPPDIITKIYEIQNIGKGIITSILPENLLELRDIIDENTDFETVLNFGSDLITSHAVTILGTNFFTITAPGGGYTSFAEETLDPLFPNAVIGRGVGLVNLEASLTFHPDVTEFIDNKNNKGIVYNSDYEANFTARSLVTKQYTDSLIASSAIFDANIPVVLGGGKTLGKYVNGQTIPAIGKTAQQVLADIAFEYIAPVFNSFSVSAQPTTVEVGTLLTGSRTFIWSIANNSGNITTVDLYDNTANVTLLAGTPNDGTQAQNITPITLNSDGANQSWKVIGNNISPPGTINSGNFGVTSRYIRWWGAVAAYPVNPVDGTANRTYANTLPNSAFKTVGTNVFNLATGTVQTRFIVLLPPGVTIVSVFDQTNANTNITPSYILSPITINDIGGTARSYNMYQYTTAIPYTVSAIHVITTT